MTEKLKHCPFCGGTAKIAKEKFYFARGEEEKQIRRVCEIAEEALKGE